MNTQTLSFGRKKLEIEGDLVSHNNGYFYREVTNPDAIMFYYDPIELDMYRIGTKACLHLRDAQNNILKLTFRSYFGFRKQKMYQVFQEVLDTLWELFFEAKMESCRTEIQAGKSVDFGRFRLNQIGISQLNQSGLVEKELRFDDCKIVPKYGKTLLYSLRDPNEHVEIDVRWDWNAYFIEKIVGELCPSST